MTSQQQAPEYRNARPEVSTDVERRFFNVEMRADATTDEMKIGGSAALYNRYTNMGWFAEVIDPGFFDGIDDSECACLLNHDANFVLGRTRSGTLKLSYTPDGLMYDCVLPKSRADVYETISRGDISQSSFGFTVAEYIWEEATRESLAGKMSSEDIDMLLSAGTVSVRHLVKGRKLYDTSPVTFPAYKDTQVAKRSYDAYLAEHPEKREDAPPTMSEIKSGIIEACTEAIDELNCAVEACNAFNENAATYAETDAENADLYTAATTLSTAAADASKAAIDAYLEIIAALNGQRSDNTIINQRSREIAILKARF